MSYKKYSISRVQRVFLITTNSHPMWQQDYTWAPLQNVVFRRLLDCRRLYGRFINLLNINSENDRIFRIFHKQYSRIQQSTRVLSKGEPICELPRTINIPHTKLVSKIQSHFTTAADTPAIATPNTICLLYST